MLSRCNWDSNVAENANVAHTSFPCSVALTSTDRSQRYHNGQPSNPTSKRHQQS
jgi:hypothetical protein